MCSGVSNIGVGWLIGLQKLRELRLGSAESRESFSIEAFNNFLIALGLNIMPELQLLEMPLFPQIELSVRTQFNNEASWKVGERGVRFIVENFKTLKQLYISHNNIGEAGAFAIAQHLKELTYLKVGHNNIGEVGAVAIVQNLTQIDVLEVMGRCVLI